MKRRGVSIYGQNTPTLKHCREVLSMFVETDEHIVSRYASEPTVDGPPTLLYDADERPLRRRIGFTW